MRKGFLAAALVIAWSGLLAPPAFAGVASTITRDLTYQALPGEANDVALTWDSRGVTVYDRGAILVVGCLPLGLNRVSCAAPGSFPPGFGCDASCHANVTLGAGNDAGHVVNAPVGPVLVVLDGGDGNDRLTVNVGTISGGAGDDVLVSEPAGTLGNVNFLCGPGNDTVHARAGDTVAADCEHVSNPNTARRSLPGAAMKGASAAIRKASRTRS